MKTTIEQYWREFFNECIKSPMAGESSDTVRMFKAVFFSGASASLSILAEAKNAKCDAATGISIVSGMIEEIKNNRMELIKSETANEQAH